MQQLKTESRADVFTAVRKLRSQRQGMIQNVVSTTSHHENTYIYISVEIFSIRDCLNAFQLITFQSQYKFIYRAISDYVDLYRSKDDEEYQYSIPVNSVNSICRPNAKKPGPSNGSIKSAAEKVS